MKNTKAIKVLIIDDSLIFRQMLARGLDQDSGIEVVGAVPDARSAFGAIKELKPDVLTVDVEMPGINGIDFVKQLLPVYPIPVVMVSSLDSRVFEALSVGAIDFVVKPGPQNMGSIGFINELIVKIKIASGSKMGSLKKSASCGDACCDVHAAYKTKLIAIGASTGGTEAILRVLEDFPPKMPGIVIVQHIPPVFSRMFAERMNNMCRLSVMEASNGSEVRCGTVLIAPGDAHMTVVRSEKGFIVRCREGEKISGHCPSVDVLFNSVAENVGSDAIGVILTGMGSDGAKGLLNMKRKGAFTIGQDEKSSVIYGMPMEAYKIGAVTKQVSLNNVAETILKNI